MGLTRVKGNLLEGKEDALLLAVDGDHPRMIGAIGRQLDRRIGDEYAWADIIAAARFPLEGGSVSLVPLENIDEVAFRYVLFVSMFNHHNEHLYLDAGYLNALKHARASGVRSIATALYTGGWRGSPEQAMVALTNACARYPEMDVVLYELDRPK